MTRRRRSTLGAVLLVFVLAANACSGGDDETPAPEPGTATAPDDPVAGGTLRYGIDAEVDGLNPTSSQLAPAGALMGRAIFDTLVTTDAEGNWTPKLAESFTPNDDFTEWTMTLRPGVTFHDGEPLDAEAVVFNFTKMYNDPLVGNAVKPYYDADEPATVVDDLTVRFNLEGAGMASWPAFLTGQLGMMSSPRWLEAVEAGTSDNQSPVGAGPFAFESRTQDSVTRLVRNPDYYDGDVWLDAVEFYPITDPAQRVDQLEVGAIDAQFTNDPESTEQLIAAADDGIVNHLNDDGSEWIVVINSQAEPFDDIRVREALAWATPRQAVIDRITGGVNRPADQMFTPEQAYYNPDVVQKADDIDKAVALVGEYCAEVPANCTDGRVDMTYQFGGPSTTDERIARLLAEGWSGAFNVRDEMFPQDTAILQAVTGQYQTSWTVNFGASEPYTERVWLACESIGPVSLNFPRYCDEERTRLYDEGGATLDEQERIEAMHQIVQTIADAHNYIFLAHSRWDTATSAQVRGLCEQSTADGVAMACPRNGMHHFDDVWLAAG